MSVSLPAQKQVECEREQSLEQAAIGKKHILCDCGTFNASRILLPDAGVTKAEAPGLLTVKSSEQIEEKLLQNVM